MKIMITFNEKEKDVFIEAAKQLMDTNEVEANNIHCSGKFGEFKSDFNNNEIYINFSTGYITAITNFVSMASNTCKTLTKTYLNIVKEWMEDFTDHTESEDIIE